MTVKNLALAAALALVVSPATAQQYYGYGNPYAQQQPVTKYNPFSNNWEMTYPNSQLNYNANQNTWQYTTPNAQPQYNPFSNRWEYPH
jgi:hypothetical protein